MKEKTQRVLLALTHETGDSLRGSLLEQFPVLAGIHFIHYQHEFLERQREWDRDGVHFTTAILPFGLPVVFGGPLVTTHDLVRACKDRGINQIIGYKAGTVYNQGTLLDAGCAFAHGETALDALGQL